MQILLISGFLGAGKTTFIQAMAKATGRHFVIVENEFSEFSIDGPLLRAKGSDPVRGEAADLEVRELSEGCICCSSKLDFSSTVVTIANTLDPDYLLVEPSGVAFPSRIMQNLKPVLYERIGLLEPITILDGLHYRNERQEFPDYFEDQVYSAKHLVVSKSEGFSTQDFEAVAKDLQLTEDVHFPLTHYSQWSKEDWLSLLTKAGEPVVLEVRGKIEADKSLENMGFQPFPCRSPDQLLYLLEELNSGKYGYIVRSKGYCKNEALWYRFDYVDGQFQIGGCEPMEDTRAIVIGRNLNRTGLKKLYLFE